MDQRAGSGGAGLAIKLRAGHPSRSGGIRGQFSFDSNEGGFFEIDAFLDHLRQPLFDTLGAMQLCQKSSACGEIRRKRK